MSIKKTKVYVAGLLTPRGVWSQNHAVDYLENIRRMVTTAKDLLLAGYDPFVPAFDCMFFIVDDRRITEAMIKRYSKSWLLACDCVFLTEGWQKSPGSRAEKKLAEEIGMPVFQRKSDMDDHYGE
jgi:hypothetical protein